MSALSNSGLVGEYADRRGTYAEHIQFWLDQCVLVDTSDDLALCLFSTSGARVTSDDNRLDYQFATLRAAIAQGAEFMFEDGKPANDWLIQFMQEQHI